MKRSVLGRWWPELLIMGTAALTLFDRPVVNVLAFSFLLLIAPGLEAATLLGFRRNRQPSFLFIVLGLSIALSPVIIYLSSLLFGFSSNTVLLGVAGVSLIMGVGGQLRWTSSDISLEPLFSRRWYRLVYAVALSMIVLLSAAPYLQIRFQDLIIAPTVNDWPKHFSVSWLIQETGIPPKNLFYWPYREQNFTYYYFFHILVAALSTGGKGALSVLNAYVLVHATGIVAFIGSVTVLTKAIVRNERALLFSTLFLFGIGGLELLTGIPATTSVIVQDGWSLTALKSLYNGLTCEAGPLSSLFDFYVWTPHHLAAGMVYALWLVLNIFMARGIRFIIITAFLMFALIGFSVYVAIPIFLALIPLVGLEIASQVNRQGNGIRWRRGVNVIASWMAIGVLFLVIAYPYLRDLSGVADAETAGVLFHISSNGDSWKVGALFVPWLGDTPIHRLLDAPTHYILDIGLLLILGGLGVYFDRRYAFLAYNSEEQSVQHWRKARFIIIMAAFFSLLITLFMSSRGAVLGFTCNDLRMRAILPLLIGLVVFSGIALNKLVNDQRRLIMTIVITMMLLGAAQTGWMFIRTSVIRFVTRTGIGSEELAAYSFLKENTPPDSLVQGDPGRELYRDRPLHIYSNRLSRVMTGLNPLLHVPNDVMAIDGRALIEALSTSSSQKAWDLLHDLEIDYVFIGPEERLAYGDQGRMTQFDDPRFFELVFDMPDYDIYRVLPE